jgi:hypothetical protein
VVLHLLLIATGLLVDLVHDLHGSSASSAIRAARKQGVVLRMTTSADVTRDSVLPISLHRPYVLLARTRAWSFVPTTNIV